MKMIPRRAPESIMPQRLRLFAPLGLAAALSGCVSSGGEVPGLGYGLVIERTQSIPAGRAHAIYQRGRQVGAASQELPFCELEVRGVAEQAQRVLPTRLRVARVSGQMLRDPITRISVALSGIDCSEPVFVESVWHLAAEAPTSVRFLRCLAPYYFCRIGGPLTPEQVQAVVGPSLRILDPAQAPVAR